jgi:hypothetical protein
MGPAFFSCFGLLAPRSAICESLRQYRQHKHADRQAEDQPNPTCKKWVM